MIIEIGTPSASIADKIMDLLRTVSPEEARRALAISHLLFFEAVDWPASDAAELLDEQKDYILHCMRSGES